MRLMLKQLPAILCILICDIALAQNREAEFLVDTTIQIMQRNAVNAKSVDWNELRRQAHADISSATSAYQVGPAIRRLYKALNDFHGSFFYKDSAFRWSHHEPVVSDSIRNEWKKGVRVRTYVLENKIGYLRIPGMPYASKEDCDARAQNLNDSLCRLLQQDIRGLVIDLRLNGGGAMYPMILGVQQLLQKGQIGSFASIKQEKWYLTDSSFSIDTTLLASIKPRCSVNGQDIPVVMLISPATGSSAEFFLIAFQGRPRTVRLGSETAGFVTGTEGFPIGDTAFVLLSTSYGVDRNGVVYKEAFKPDIPFAGNDSFNDIPGDEKVREAVKWLKKQIKH